ncbi:similar to Saccharomyces cerevisiae YOR043W WHI2 Protein required, with binding partner Psr1p, for full activation of the general stress response, possibly through Msn2p dephosphorylation [Maudiozyma barnettii]|uniref:Similar to Saccharomyces cerevisiae YOR043W WHI2 Protein required, with binding partner Psr1p, for full activation of the general stress response, possibly through Msn2p dephosphorylation n=1 Tax=Maudiozyma barnettii TaxID=61262 RepID=A0A8H2VJ37_9SACH|nr:Whi2p [Kazachstania barnettii]CAB4256290.1 similar to Saccharomyces cerevisiae YOR043W WHI2 Protein required, with binding partner Psr1p, for full activation of the general stress response, possibly through Msn2p dephosphorylation [Kazachstania barnettii]CAD1784899.1 similar to Saccharomyces cerevisiae YOR043W WHI2 Protein required, with binding partner Psr1p, for full activation of the general stress response, possibly through Msn2p dephosphorylation [Kazachstania barnettii]
MQNIITQVSQDGSGVSPLLHDNGMGANNQEYYEGMENDAYGNSLIHLNIQENHYFITRDQLMSLPESLLLCLFPSGVFLDRDGQVITNLTPDDEVYIMNFPPDCFEYIMEVFTRAHDDMINHPVEKLFARNSSNNLVNSAKGFFGFNNGSGSSSANGSGTPNEHNILHQKPAIIVLREDLDYYCVPQQQFKFESIGNVNGDNVHMDPETIRENNNDLLHHFMAQIKIAAGSYLANKTSVFQGLFSSNRLRYQNNNYNSSGKTHHNSSTTMANEMDLSKLSSKKLGPAEQHLMDMLCSSGFTTQSIWGNRTQEAGKTVISSLSLCRLANESTEMFRATYNEAKLKWEMEHGINGNGDAETPSETNLSATVSASSLNSSTNTNHQHHNNNYNNKIGSRTVSGNNAMKTSSTSSDISAISNKDGSHSSRKDKKKSRFSVLADNVRSHSSSRNSSQLKLGGSNINISGNHAKHSPELPKVYDLVPKPDINEKLLLFWRKPARKCWWGDEEIELNVEIYGTWADDKHTTIRLKLPSMTNTEAELNRISVPVRLHIRRVWTLELSVIGVQ